MEQNNIEKPVGPDLGSIFADQQVIESLIIYNRPPVVIKDTTIQGDRITTIHQVAIPPLGTDRNWTFSETFEAGQPTTIAFNSPDGSQTLSAYSEPISERDAEKISNYMDTVFQKIETGRTELS